MQQDAARLLHPGVRPSQVQRRAPAVVLLLLFLVPIAQPVTTAEIASDDFGILDALDELLKDRSLSSSDLIAESIASTTLSSVDAAARDVGEGDAIVEAERFLDGLEVRDSSPFEPDHPRAYEFLLDAENHSGAGLPDNLFQTLFSVENWELTDPLAIGINTYAIYLNFSSKNDGPSYESWTSGTFTGDIQVGGDLNLFDNYIDIDGDGAEDVIVELTVQGLLQRGQGWDITTSGGVGPLPGLIPETLWIRPIFQWRVHQIDANDPLWDDMAFLEVSLLKGFAFDFTVQDSESYSIVIDTRFTQPPHEFRVGVGLDRITFEIADTVTDVTQLLLDLLGGEVSVLLGHLIEVHASCLQQGGSDASFAEHITSVSDLDAVIGGSNGCAECVVADNPDASEHSNHVELPIALPVAHATTSRILCSSAASSASGSKKTSVAAAVEGRDLSNVHN